MKISVVTVCLNAALTIEDTLKSVVSQTHHNVEHIVIDGGSTDGTAEIVQKYPVRFISEPDDGIYSAMNKGIRLATGDYVGFLNADDLFYDRFALEAISKGTADLLYGNIVMFSDKNPGRITRYYTANGFRPWQMRFGQMPPHPSVYVKRSMLLKCGGFDESYKTSSDFDLLVRLILKQNCSTQFIDSTLVRFRTGGLTTRGINSTIAINRDFYRSLRSNGIWTHPLLLALRYIPKSLQIVRRPSNRMRAEQ